MILEMNNVIKNNTSPIYTKYEILNFIIVVQYFMILFPTSRHSFIHDKCVIVATIASVLTFVFIHIYVLTFT